jgi:predicted N-acetyltransferase YhbS
VHQGNRHGTALVRYGLDLAAKEDIAASVISAAKKEVAEEFYAKLGFKSIGVRAVDGEGNPLSGIEGGQIMFKDKQ